MTLQEINNTAKYIFPYLISYRNRSGRTIEGDQWEKYITTAIFSKYVEAKAIGSNNATEIAEFLFDLICRCGIFCPMSSRDKIEICK